MKRLYLVRHAKSSWKEPELEDHERPLNKRGKNDAPVMGRRLKKLEIAPDLIISSHAKRALKTAKIIAKEIDYPSKKIVVDKAVYDSDALSLLEVIHNLDDSLERVMLFGHNPTFTNLAVYLTNHYIDNIPTCGVFCIDFDFDSWRKAGKGNGKLVFFEYPKGLK